MKKNKFYKKEKKIFGGTFLHIYNTNVFTFHEKDVEDDQRKYENKPRKYEDKPQKYEGDKIYGL